MILAHGASSGRRTLNWVVAAASASLAMMVTDPDAAMAAAPAPEPGAYPPAGLQHPKIVRYATPDEMTRLYPSSALYAGVAGSARIDCVIAFTAQLRDCVIKKEDPLGYDFGQAAIRVADLMRIQPAIYLGHPVLDGHYQLQIRFQLPPDPNNPLNSPSSESATTAPAPPTNPPPHRSTASLWLCLAFTLAFAAALPAALFWTAPSADPQPSKNKGRRPPGAYA